MIEVQGPAHLSLLVRTWSEFLRGRLFFFLFFPYFSFFLLLKAQQKKKEKKKINETFFFLSLFQGLFFLQIWEKKKVQFGKTHTHTQQKTNDGYLFR